MHSLIAVYDFVIKLHFLSKPSVLSITLAVLPAVLTLLFTINKSLLCSCNCLVIMNQNSVPMFAKLERGAIDIFMLLHTHVDLEF